MARLTTITNPFDPLNSRVISDIESGKPIYSVIAGFYCYHDVVVSVNGQIIHDYEYIIKPEDHVGFLAVPEKGGGKNPLAMIAMIALSIAVPIAAPALLGAMGMASGTMAFALASGALSMGMMMAGGMLINALLPPSSISNSPTQSISSSPTYGWDSVQNQSAEGIVLPIVYGKTRITPPIISQYVETVNNKQYLNILYALNDGEIASVSGIMINDNPSSYYNGVTIETRLGTNAQTLIPSFDNTRVDTGVGAKLSTTEMIRQTSYNNVTGLSIVVSAPSGIYYANDGGGLNSKTIDLEIKYRKVGNPTWVNYTVYTPIYGTDSYWDPDKYMFIHYTVIVGYSSNSSISGASTSPIRKTFSIDNLEAGQYEISIYRTTQESTLSRMQDKVYFEGFTEIIYDDFIYPNTALMAVRALATDQLSGSMPKVSCVVDRGFGTSNPSVAAQDILMLSGATVNQSLFDSWAAWCDSQNFKCNIVFDSEINVRESLNIVGMLGRANIIQMGATYLPIIERAETLPVQKFLFTMGNIIRDSFKEEYLPLADRSNAVEVTYFDETLNYERQAVETYQHGYDESVDTTRKASVTLYGCTDRTQAIRHGRFLMNKNRYLTNTVSFEADIDAIACTIGDIIDVSHDVPQWGYSGRLINVDVADTLVDDQVVLVNGITATSINTNYIELDRELNIIGGVEYGIIIRLMDDTTETITIKTTYDINTFIVPIPSTLAVTKFDLFVFGDSARVTKTFRVISISRSSEQRRKITAIEYIEQVYDDAIDVISVENISGLSEVTYFMIDSSVELTSSGHSINVLTLIWAGQSISWDIYVLKDNTWELLTNSIAQFYQIRDVNAGTYSFKIGDKIRTITLSVAAVPLPDVINFTDYFNGSTIALTWDTIVDIRTPIEYEIRHGSSWDNGQSYSSTSGNQFIPQNLGVYWIKARYYDPFINNYIYSENAKGISLSGTNIVKNYIAQFDEEIAWVGDLLNASISNGNILLPGSLNISEWGQITSLSTIMYAGGVIQHGYYTVPDSHIVDIGSAQKCCVSCSYSAIGFNVFDLVSNWVLISSISSIIGNSGSEWSVIPQISIAGNDGIFGDWKQFIPGDYIGRLFKIRLYIESKNQNISVMIDSFKWSVDVPDRLEKGNAIEIPIEGISIAYTKPFLGTPNTQITILNAQQGDYYELSNQTLNGFDLIMKNGTAAVARSINWISQSY